MVMKRDINSLLVKLFLVAFPFLLLLLLYVLCDPFKVLRPYHFENYYDWQPHELNRENASVSNWRDRLNAADTPNSYIMGNSRSLAFHCPEWETHLGENASAFHFDAASESLYGVLKKLEYLKSHHLPIKNILLVCDESLLKATKNADDVIHVKHYSLSGQSYLLYQSIFVKAFFNNLFCVKFIDYNISHRIKLYMKDVFAIQPGYFSNKAFQNDYFYTGYELKLKQDSLGYYSEFKKGEFWARPQQEKTGEAVIQKESLAMLQAIRRMQTKQKFEFNIIISPLFNQERLAAGDKKVLENLFGEAHVFDFSGVNAITTNTGNYYESSHYKPFVANQILDSVYRHP